MSRTDNDIMPAGATVAATADHFLDVADGAVTPPIVPSTTFARDDRYELLNPAYSYARSNTPATQVARNMLMSLECGQDAALFSSGMAAVAAVFYTLNPGAHVVIPDSMYWGVLQWVCEYCQRMDIRVSMYDPADTESIGSVCSAANPANIVWAETPSNPMLCVTDIRRAATLAHQAGAMLIVDSTAATPVFCQPLVLGADIVMHSATKYLNGHSDVLAGVLVTADRSSVWEKIVAEQQQAGAVLGAFEAWLLVRGMRTLFVRVQRAADNAQRIAQFLNQHPGVESVLYPGLPDHPGHTIAKAQMKDGFGALLSFLVKVPAGSSSANPSGDKSMRARAVAGALQHIVSATSLGGVETLIEHRYSIEPEITRVPANLLRLSVGIEACDDLIADLDQALRDF